MISYHRRYAAGEGSIPIAGFVTGTNGSDRITDFRDFSRTVLALAGNDTVDERVDDDAVDGGAGADTYRLGGGADEAEVYDGDPATVETVLEYDDDEIETRIDGHEESFEYFTIAQTGSNSAQIRFF